MRHWQSLTAGPGRNTHRQFRGLSYPCLIASDVPASVGLVRLGYHQRVTALKHPRTGRVHDVRGLCLQSCADLVRRGWSRAWRGDRGTGWCRYTLPAVYRYPLLVHGAQRGPGLREAGRDVTDRGTVAYGGGTGVVESGEHGVHHGQEPGGGRAASGWPGADEQDAVFEHPLVLVVEQFGGHCPAGFVGCGPGRVVSGEHRPHSRHGHTVPGGPAVLAVVVEVRCDHDDGPVTWCGANRSAACCTVTAANWSEPR